MALQEGQCFEINYLREVWPGPVYYPDFLNPHSHGFLEEDVTIHTVPNLKKKHEVSVESGSYYCASSWGCSTWFFLASNGEYGISIKEACIKRTMAMILGRNTALDNILIIGIVLTNVLHQSYSHN